MKQLISHIVGDHVLYALVDGDDMIPFASILLPDPEAFGMHEAAVLGANLVESLGLNGHSGATTPPAIDAPRPEGVAVPIGRRPAAARRYITLELVLDAIRAHPEGLTLGQIADVVLSAKERKDKAMRKQIANRLANHLQRVRRHGDMALIDVEHNGPGSRNRYRPSTGGPGDT